MAAVRETTDATFDADVLQAPGLVLVDFWAPWCGPCRKVAPILEELAGELEGKVTIVKMNTDANQTVPMRYGITSIPTLNVYQGGELVKSLIGAKPKPQLLRELEPLLA